eukprot:scaffold181975_cov25-Prasinocladus_malaysianus.AAC.1
MEVNPIPDTIFTQPSMFSVEASRASQEVISNTVTKHVSSLENGFEGKNFVSLKLTKQIVKDLAAYL